MEEKDAIKKAKNGDSRAFDYLYEKYKSDVYGYFFNRVRNSAAAEELVQDLFLKISRNIKCYDETRANFYKFIWENAKQVYIDYVKRENTKKRKFEKDVLGLAEFDDENNLDDEDDYEVEDSDILRKLIMELCETQRIAIIMRYYKKKSYKEIAERLGKSEISVKAILHRAKKTIKDRMREQYPEMTDRMSKKYIAKMVAFIAMGIVAVSGLAYATYRIYNDVIKKTYTLSELREDVPESESIITRDEAIDKINYYLDVLGEDEVSVDDIKLVRDVGSYEICWKVKNDKHLISINSRDSSLVAYNNFNNTGILVGDNISNLYEKLNLPSDYELYNEKASGKSIFVEYAKKYDGIYNKYESFRISIYDNRVEYISVLNYPCEDGEVIISEERALEIAKENGIEVYTMDLSIENVSDLPVLNMNYICEELDENNREDIKIIDMGVLIKKVWKIKSKDNLEILIDANTERVIYNSDVTFRGEKE